MATRVYELVALLEPNATKEVAKSVSINLTNLLSGLGASHIVYTCWGKISLAYKIRSFDMAFGLHLSFVLDRRRERLLGLKANICKQFKLLRAGLFLSNVASAKIKPSFYTAANE
ncbi:MAG: hypothetical protein AAI946_00155 [Candidatus Hodgkinia cicadicola]